MPGQGALLQTLAATLARPVGDAERKSARLLLLDWLACVAGARDSEAGHLGGEISRLGWERATYVGNALEMDDVHEAARVHPGSIVWPAAMSMSSAAMDARLDAGVRGYEAMIAVGSALDTHHHSHWDASATAGVFGAAAAFGSLIGFAPVEYANAMGNAGSVAGGLLHMGHDDVLTRQWHVYHTVRTGRDAAMHVHYGATGPVGILEGAQGLLPAMTKEAGTLGSNGRGWLIQQVSFKPLPTTDSLAPPIHPLDEAQIADKMHAFGKMGGLSAEQCGRAANLALHGNEPAAIDTMLEEWLA
ncbi:MAG: MmgE/PrpD family protein [Marinomonas sp.]|uniref:MmgE/PrpD family protein n=1 Tax=Parasphingorhabdus sp. TaxID=2709688 RepID=UPI0032648B31